MSDIRLLLARWFRETRLRLGLSQEQVAGRVGVSRGYIGSIEHGLANPSVDLVMRIGEALDLDLELFVRAPLVLGGSGQRDVVHARSSGYVDRRLRTSGLATAREVEIVHGRSHGWIDLLAFESRTSTLLTIEIKTRLDDLGALERQIGWYERSAADAARRIGWSPDRVVSWLLVLASAEAEATIRANRAIFDHAFPVRADSAMGWLSDVASKLPQGRVLALIDPASRRRDWLIRTRFDGRRSDPPYRDYADAARRMTPR
jgi:transcriptional regulator with XRE-family HTH domain